MTHKTSEAKRAYQRKWYADNRDRVKPQRDAWKTANPERVKAYQRKSDSKRQTHERNLYRRPFIKKWQQDLRDQIITGYGGSCRCCGEQEPVFLALDHVDNDGCQERRSYAGGSKTYLIYKKAIEDEFPSRYQLLCHNCNWGKHRMGVCPHQGRPEQTSLETVVTVTSIF